MAYIWAQVGVRRTVSHRPTCRQAYTGQYGHHAGRNEATFDYHAAYPPDLCFNVTSNIHKRTSLKTSRTLKLFFATGINRKIGKKIKMS